MQWSHLVSLGNGSVGVKTLCCCERYFLKECIKKKANICFAQSYTPILISLYDFSCWSISKICEFILNYGSLGLG